MVMEHIRQLATVIGPRPATTDAEANAADYIEGVFRAQGLTPERQEFECPRTRSWAAVTCCALTVMAAVLARWWGWPALALAVLGAVLLRLELDVRPGLSRLLPRGPSQNIIARHLPNVRRGDRLQRVVIVAPYDSPKPSLFDSPNLVRSAWKLKMAAWWMAVATAVFILFGRMPFAAEWTPWIGYVTLLAGVYPLVFLVMTLYGEIAMQPGEGANHNASGVAALLGVMQATVPAPNDHTTRFVPMRHSAEVAREADVVIEDALLEYRPVGGPPADGSYRTARLEGFDDTGWESGPINISNVVTPRPAAPEAFDDLSADVEWVEPGATEGQASLDLPLDSGHSHDFSHDEPSEDEHVEPSSPRRAILGGPSAGRRQSTSRDRTPHILDAGEADAEPATDPEREHATRGVRDWLGVGSSFDVRKAGRKIGSWENIDEDEDEEAGFKFGMAGGEPEPTEAELAARIRRRVTERVDRALAEKEIWFVATGASAPGAFGMRALLVAYGDDLRDALFIVIDGVGSGTLSFVTSEGLMTDRHADRRLVAQAKRTAREGGFEVTSRKTRGVLTEALTVLRARRKAMSLMAFDINGLLPDRAWPSDTIENVAEANVERAVAFVTALVRDL